MLQLGAVNQYGEAQDDGDARAASGAVSDQGAISVGGSEAFPANASLNLNPLLAGVGADGLVDDLSLDLGAVSSSAEQLDGGPVVTDYDVATATLNLSSPAIGAVYTDLLGTVEETQGSLNGLSETVSTALDAGIELGTLANLSTEVDFTPPDLSSTLPDAVIGNSSGVTVDLTTGAVTVDLATLLAANPELPDLNALPANSELLSGPVVAAISDGVTQAATDAVSTVVQDLDETIGATQLEVVADVDVILAGSATVTVSGSLDEILAGEGGGTVDVVTDGPLGGLLGLLGLSDANELGDLVLGAVSGVLGETFDVLTDTEGVVDGVTGPLATDVVGTLLNIVNQVVAVTVNSQPAEGDLGTDSTTVRALQLRLLPGEAGSLATVNLAASTVRGTNVEVPVFDPAITVDPSTVEQGASTEVTGGGFAAEESVTVSIPGAGEGDDPITVETTTNADGEFVVDLPVPADYPTGEVTVTAVGAESETPATAELVVTTSDDGAADPDGAADAAADPDANVDASASASASADADADADPAAQAAAQAASDADAETAASADASASADADADPAAQAAAESAANVDASSAASTDADSASEAAAQAASDADADSEAAADASAAADPDAAAAAQAAANADASSEASAAAASDADAAADPDGAADAAADPDGAADGDVEVDPSLTVQPDAVQPGEDVGISGGGFVPESSVTVVVTDADGNVIDTIEAVGVDQNGEFAVTWTVPEGTEPGELTFTATDDSDEDIAANATVEVTDGAATEGEPEGAEREDGLLAATGAAGIWVLVGLSAVLLLGGAALLIARTRMSSTE